jgi:hypothetical protein
MTTKKTAAIIGLASVELKPKISSAVRYSSLAPA